MGTMAFQITSLTIVYSSVYSGADQRKHQSFASLAICAKNSPGTGEFPAQTASYAENVSIWWRHHSTGPKQHLGLLSLSDGYTTIRIRCLGNVAAYFHYPANTKRDRHAIITSKQCFEVIITCLLRCVFAGHLLTRIVVAGVTRLNVRHDHLTT